MENHTRVDVSCVVDRHRDGTPLTAVDGFVGEDLQPARIVTFALIWAGLLVYSWSGWQKYRQG